MGVRENKVEDYINEQVIALGGITRKWVSPGRNGVPDRIVIRDGQVCFVEVKTIDGNFEPSQEREHNRLRAAGATVCTACGEKGVDQLIEDLRLFNKPMVKYYG